jgi:hypothetical protein
MKSERTADAQSIRNRNSETNLTYSQIIDLLRVKPRHTFEFRDLEIANPAPRIMELIDKGYVIHKQRVKIIDSDGNERNNVTLYSLLAEPKCRRDSNSSGA